MNILVIGASGGTGALAVSAALAKGHSVTAFARSPEKLVLDNTKLRRVAGSFHDGDAVLAVVGGHDAVLVTASATSLRGFKDKPDYFSDGTAKVIAAMSAHGVRRLAVLSALGTGDSRNLLAWPLRVLVVDRVLKTAFVDHDVQERLVRESGLDWVIARPGRLTNGPALGKYKATPKIEPVPSSISRADVAGFLVRAVEEPEWFGHTVQIGG